MALYRAVCNSRNHTPPGVWIYPADGGVDYKTADGLANQHMVIDYPDPDGNHDARVEEYVPPPAPPHPPRPQPLPQPPPPQQFCKGECNSTVAAAGALTLAYAALPLACSPPQAPVACPLAIVAVVVAQQALIGNQQQYDKCLREHQQHAAADSLQGAMDAIAADVQQLQDFSAQLQA